MYLCGYMFAIYVLMFEIDFGPHDMRTKIEALDACWNRGLGT